MKIWEHIVKFSILAQVYAQTQISARLRWQLLVFGCLLPLDDQWIRAAKHQRRSKTKQT